MEYPQKQSALSASQGPKIIKNKFEDVMELDMTIAATADGEANNVLLVFSPLPNLLVAKLNVTKPDQDDITLSSSVSAGDDAGLLQLQAYLSLMGFHVKGIRMQTDTPSIYGGNLLMGEIGPDGITRPKKINLSKFATNLGAGTYDKTLVLSGMDFVFTKNFYLFLSKLPASSTTTITFEVDAMSDSVTVS